MLPEAHVFIACSLDGFIARPDGGLDWLTGAPVPEGEDFGYAAFIAGIDAILMGRATFELAAGFADWPYAQPVAVLSRTRGPDTIPERLRGRARIAADGPRAALEALAAEGARRVYVDGGQVISACLREGLVSELTITRLPVLLGAGLPLFSDTGEHRLAHVATRDWPNGFVQSVYRVAGPAA
jgi:dihydrofolate reductase